MQRFEKVFEQSPECRQFYWGSNAMHGRLVEMAKMFLILCVPFAVESVHELLGRII
jgi:hypothetical protein